MPETGYRFVQRVFDDSGAEAVRHEVADFRPLAADAAFSGVIEGRLANDGDWGETATEPVWDGGVLAGVAVSARGYRKSYGLDVFSDHALAALLAGGLLGGGDDPGGRRSFKWSVEARAAAEARPSRRPGAFVKREPFPVSNGPAAVRVAPARGGCAICVSSALLAELRELAAANLDRERADFLTGRLIVADGAAVVELSGRIPAEAETGSSATHFGFSPESFAIARREQERRRDGRAILAWAHNHPPSCRRDCLLRVPACESGSVFFSVHDRMVHRAGFTAPFAAALVAGKAPNRRADDPEVRAYGWQDGVIAEKELHVFQGDI